MHMYVVHGCILVGRGSPKSPFSINSSTFCLDDFPTLKSTKNLPPDFQTLRLYFLKVETLCAAAALRPDAPNSSSFSLSSRFGSSSRSCLFWHRFFTKNLPSLMWQKVGRVWRRRTLGRAAVCSTGVYTIHMYVVLMYVVLMYVRLQYSGTGLFGPNVSPNTELFMGIRLKSVHDLSKVHHHILQSLKFN